MFHSHVLEQQKFPNQSASIFQGPSFSKYLPKENDFLEVSNFSPSHISKIFQNTSGSLISSSCILLWLKCRFVAQSKISSASFSKPTSQRPQFFFCHVPSMSHVSSARRKTEKTSDCLRLFVAFPEILLYAIWRSLVPSVMTFIYDALIESSSFPLAFCTRLINSLRVANWRFFFLQWKYKQFNILELSK